MTAEPSDAETCLHVSISEANRSCVIAMTNSEDDGVEDDWILQAYALRKTA